MDPLPWLLSGNGTLPGAPGADDTLFALLLAFILSQLLAWTYYATHSGLSYSRGFVQSLILIAIVVAMVMATVANSFVTALSLLGAMALIRFRNMLKDTRDIAFVFGALVIGMAAGAHRYPTAIVGTLFFCACAIYLYLSNFGAHQPHDGFLQFTLRDASALERDVVPMLRRCCRSYLLITARREPDAAEASYAFQLMLRGSTSHVELVDGLERLGTLRGVSLTMQERLLEV